MGENAISTNFAYPKWMKIKIVFLLKLAECKSYNPTTLKFYNLQYPKQSDTSRYPSLRGMTNLGLDVCVLLSAAIHHVDNTREWKFTISNVQGNARTIGNK